MTTSLDELAGLCRHATRAEEVAKGGVTFTHAGKVTLEPADLLKLLAVVKAAKAAQEWIIDAQTGNALDAALREIE